MTIHRLTLLVSLLALSPVAAQIRERAPSGIRITYKCQDKGRYTVEYDQGKRHFCFDGKHYTENTLPIDARQFFNDLDATMADVQARVAQIPRSQPAPARLPASRPAPSAAGVPASTRPPARAVPLDAVNTIQTGQPLADVVAKLGQPSGRLTGLADGEERWSYLLQSGGTARLRVKDDKVLSVLLP